MQMTGSNKSEDVGPKVTIQDLFDYCEKSWEKLFNINKLVLVSEEDRKELFVEFLKYKFRFMRSCLPSIEERPDGVVKIYTVEQCGSYSREYQSWFFPSMKKANVFLFERLIDGYNSTIRGIIARPTVEDAKKFPELYTMKREPWGD